MPAEMKKCDPPADVATDPNAKFTTQGRDVLAEKTREEIAIRVVIPDGKICGRLSNECSTKSLSPIVNNLHSHFRDVADRLEALRNVFPAGKEGSRYLGFFEEYLRANELELALHAVCDFLLEPTTPQPADDALSKIKTLHELMGLEDDCVPKLRRKSG